MTLVVNAGRHRRMPPQQDLSGSLSNRQAPRYSRTLLDPLFPLGRKQQQSPLPGRYCRRPAQRARKEDSAEGGLKGMRARAVQCSAVEWRGTHRALQGGRSVRGPATFHIRAVPGRGRCSAPEDCRPSPLRVPLCCSRFWCMGEWVPPESDLFEQLAASCILQHQQCGVTAQPSVQAATAHKGSYRKMH